VAQLRDGVAGWICAVLPLIVVNLLGALGWVTTEDALVTGAIALLASPLVGGAAAGLLGGQWQRGHPGGASGALPGALIAGSLYLVTLLGLVVAAGRLGTEPELLAAHPVRVALAAVCLSCVLAMVALGSAALVSRRSQASGAAAASQPTQRPSAATTRRPAAPTSNRTSSWMSVAIPAARSATRQSTVARRPAARSASSPPQHDGQR
jgi:hypothetical protein